MTQFLGTLFIVLAFIALIARLAVDQTVPAGFSCWPGGGTGVVIPSG